MRKILWALLVAVSVAGIASCLKDDDYEPCVEKTLEQDQPLMTQFAASNSITTTADASGILYEIIEPGSDQHPTTSSRIVAKYEGKNMGGVVFDSGQFPEAYPLSNLIRGWQVILPKIGVGGKMKMIIPSSLAYGCNAPDAKVLNQPLYFDVELISIQ